MQEVIMKFINNVQMYAFVFSVLYLFRMLFFFFSSYHSMEKKVNFDKSTVLTIGITLTFVIASLINGIKY